MHSIVWPTPSPTTHPKVTQPAARFLCDSWATCYESPCISNAQDMMKAPLVKSIDSSTGDERHTPRIYTVEEHRQWNLVCKLIEKRQLLPPRAFMYMRVISILLHISVLFLLPPVASVHDTRQTKESTTSTSWLSTRALNGWLMSLSKACILISPNLAVMTPCVSSSILTKWYIISKIDVSEGLIAYSKTKMWTVRYVHDLIHLLWEDIRTRKEPWRTRTTEDNSTAKYVSIQRSFRAQGSSLEILYGS